MTQTKLANLMRPLSLPAGPSIALLVLRLIAGTAFVLHGWGKIQNPFNWMGPQAAMPGFLQLLAAFSEFAGGVAWVIGLLSPLAALGIGCTMTVAVYMHSMVLNDPFVNLTGGRSFEQALVYLGIALLILAFGAGKFSLDRLLFGERVRSDRS